jgi:hypothetical protein
VVGTSWPDVEPVGVAFESTDGESWQPAAFEGIEPGWWFQEVTFGERGWLATVWTGAAVQVIASSDGRSWTAVTDLTMQGASVAAGDEGFVADGIDERDGRQVVAISASSDGVTWFDATTPEGDAFVVAPLGGDWVAIGSTFGETFSAQAFASSNGLDWTELGEVPLADVSFSAGGETTRCGEAPAGLHPVAGIVVLGMTLRGPCSEGGVIAAGGSYASVDGAEWTRLPFGDQAFAGGAATIGDRIVIATDARTNRADVIGVRFWISD